MKITKIKINNFKSLSNITIPIKHQDEYVCFCGQNNVGKTNILKAINLFFENVEYEPKEDSPHHKYYGSRGGATHPKIEITFVDGVNKFSITKDYKDFVKDGAVSLYGVKNKEKLNDLELKKFFKNTSFFFLPSINISFPDAIKYLMDNDLIDVEFGNSRMKGKKVVMKEQIETVINGLQKILDNLGADISPLLEKYKKDWGIGFSIPNEINTFRDLMIGEIDFYIKDSSNSKAIEGKGSGLQRLCHILIYFRILEKLNSKKQKVILAIDEPDVYLHTGLQKILLDDLQKISKKNQVFITTHSPVFIDTRKLHNVFLLEQKIEPKTYKRAERKHRSNEFNEISTELVKLSENTGITKLKAYLGIENQDALLFDKFNILVEGAEDKIYIEKLLSYFGFEIPNIIPCGGADNIQKYLEYYNSLAKKEDSVSFRIILDNDQKGRDVEKKIKPNTYGNLTICKEFVVAHSGYAGDITQGSNSNVEIEDLLAPELLCFLSNKIIKKIDLISFDKKTISEITKNISLPAFRDKGMLSLLDYKKSELNPTDTALVINSVGFKMGLANIFANSFTEVNEYLGEKDDIKNVKTLEWLQKITKSI